MSPYAITMWDFSWLERRWPGAGFEDWDQALGELVERGYDTVRIEAYPHLVAAGPERTWELLPQWNQQDWGAPAIVRVQVLPALIDFIAAARRHGVSVTLSTWFRQDRDDTRMTVITPQEHARIWSVTLRHLDEAGVLDNVRFVDLCNEFPLPLWAPFLYGRTTGEILPRSSERVRDWTTTAIRELRSDWPGLDLTFSVTKDYDDIARQDVSEFDLLEPHLWMASYTDFYRRVGYRFELFDPAGYENVVARGEQTYRADQERYDRELF
ncbi:MAG: cellulase, partial [Naasia sp.]|nr:cellulase [Naasia sp.]